MAVKYYYNAQFNNFAIKFILETDAAGARRKKDWGSVKTWKSQKTSLLSGELQSFAGQPSRLRSVLHPANSAIRNIHRESSAITKSKLLENIWKTPLQNCCDNSDQMRKRKRRKKKERDRVSIVLRDKTRYKGNILVKKWYNKWDMKSEKSDISWYFKTVKRREKKYYLFAIFVYR